MKDYIYKSGFILSKEDWDYYPMFLFSKFFVKNGPLGACDKILSQLDKFAFINATIRFKIDNVKCTFFDLDTLTEIKTSFNLFTN